MIAALLADEPVLLGVLVKNGARAMALRDQGLINSDEHRKCQEEIRWVYSELEKLGKIRNVSSD